MKIEDIFEWERDELKPTVGSKFSAGVDFRAKGNALIIPGDVTKVPLGVRLKKDIEMPFDWMLMLAIRSSMTAKHSIIMGNGVGIIDSDYEGEICALLSNLGHETWRINEGDKICQGIITPVTYWDDSNKVRGEGGFGSTGS